MFSKFNKPKISHSFFQIQPRLSIHISYTHAEIYSAYRQHLLLPDIPEHIWKEWGDKVEAPSYGGY